jgi:isoaspartyl peptidase/L-asparaginase-like protein (Ntn-hydrolase superfamily)
MMRTLAAKAVCDLVAAGRTARMAATAAVRALPAQAGESGGMIALDARGRIGVAMRGGVMPHAWAAAGAARIRARLRG